MKSCIVDFEEPGAANTALLLTGTPLLNKPISISKNPASLPKTADGLPIPSLLPSIPTIVPPNITPATTPGITHIPLIPGLIPQLPQLPMLLPNIPLVSPLAMLQNLNAAMLAAAAVAPQVSAIPSNSPFQSANAQKVDEVARTVYVGNLHPKVL